ncbi:hypothetical protein N7466_001615 [Penicillium verhagenii]|uniref:uncharacterized protein n=1 Tax=Penicillium verhagenii TaxID=1562060 RepID=UPI002545823A|nr:uncharacterized protein N7466_001615 [Penicillium verhagenii]KAJ5938481.1 hypothetical protein N7466_001615 [Penicillium verhagenii]
MNHNPQSKGLNGLTLGRLSFAQLLLILAYIFVQAHTPSDDQLEFIVRRKEEDWIPQVGQERLFDMSQHWNAEDEEWKAIRVWMVRNKFCNKEVQERNLRDDLYRLLYRIEQVSAQSLNGLKRRKPQPEAEAGLDSTLSLMLVCYSLSVLPSLWHMDGLMKPPIWELDDYSLEKMFKCLGDSPLFPNLNKGLVIAALYALEMLFTFHNPGEHEYPGEDNNDHPSNRPYKCFRCKQSFKRSAERNRHEDKQHADPKIKCTYKGCKRLFGFRDQRSLSCHSMKHPRHCPMPNCQESFGAKRSLHSHLNRIHSDSGKHQSPGEHENHGEDNDDHQSDRPHKCSRCKQSFERSAERILHANINHADPNIKCTYRDCRRPYGFADKESLYRHQRRHREGNRFKCPDPDCNRSYKSKYALSAHLHHSHSASGIVIDSGHTVCSTAQSISHMDHPEPSQHADRESKRTFHNQNIGSDKPQGDETITRPPNSNENEESLADIDSGAVGGQSKRFKCKKIHPTTSEHYTQGDNEKSQGEKDCQEGSHFDNKWFSLIHEHAKPTDRILPKARSSPETRIELNVRGNYFDHISYTLPAAKRPRETDSGGIISGSEGPLQDRDTRPLKLRIRFLCQ